MSDLFFRSGDSELLRQLLTVLGAESRILVLISRDLRITDLTDAAQLLLGQGVLSPLSQLLTRDTVSAIDLCMRTQTGATLTEEIDDRYFNIEVRPTGDGALLYFHEGESRASEGALHQLLSERTDAALATILLATRKLAANPPEKMAHTLTDAIRTCSLRIHRMLLHAQTLASPPGSILADLQPGDVAALCREAIEKASMRLRDGLSIRAEIPAECPVVFDRRLLLQAVYNLLANAMAAGGVSTVTLRLTHTPGNVSLSVIDDGAGLPPEALAHLYDGWQSTQTAEKLLSDAAAGIRWGLGLPLARRIAGLHSGVLLMQSREPQGTVFTLTFPDDLRPLMTFGQPPIRIEDGFDPAEVELSTLPYTL
ncbi:MAG: sensor histidine kinase [Intestinibacillus sp.]